VQRSANSCKILLKSAPGARWGVKLGAAGSLECQALRVKEGEGGTKV